MDRAHESAELARGGLALARRVGNRYWEWFFLGFAYPLFALGDWTRWSHEKRAYLKRTGHRRGSPSARF